MQQQQPQSIGTTTSELPEHSALPPSLIPLTRHRSMIRPHFSYDENRQIPKPPLIPPPSSHKKSSLFATIHFFFAIKLIRSINSLGKTPLKVGDLPNIKEKESCEELEKKFTETFYKWIQQDPQKRTSIEFAFLKLFKRDYAFQFFWQLVQGSARLMIGYFLYLMLIDIRGPNPDPHHSYIPSIGLFLSNLIAFYAMHQASFNVSYTAHKMRTGLLGMLYRKITKLSLAAVHNLNLGKVINVIANESNSLERAHIVSLLTAPLIFLGGFGILFYFWGVSCLVGLGYMAVTWILQLNFPGKTLRIRIQSKLDTDERINYLNETLEGIRTIKILAWEFNVIEKIKKLRATEVKDSRKAAILDCIPRAILYTSHWIAGFLIYFTYTQTTGNITSILTFPTMIILGALRQFCMLQFYSVITFFFEMRGFCLRVVSIMNLPEVQPVQSDIPPPISSENAIEFHDFTAFWMKRDLEAQPPPKPPKIAFKRLRLVGIPKFKPPSNQIPFDNTHPAISNINLEIKKGSFVVIIGQIGSGKSTLLASLTGELAHQEGELRYSGSYAHVGQRPILGAGATIKEIILSNQPYDKEKFQKTIEACDLSYDLENLPEHENTNIGERAIVLNEMQRAKLILARAIYSGVDIYLLDDPFSWMNWNSGKHIFEAGILGLLKEKTVVLATFRLYMLQFADQVVVMKDGKIAAKGTLQELEEQNIDLNALIGFHEDAPIQSEHGITTDHTKQRYQEIVEEMDQEAVLSEETQCFVASRQDEGLVLEHEKLDDGKVHISTYHKYFSELLNWLTTLPFIGLFIGGEMFAWLYLYFIGKWSKAVWSDTLAYEVIGPLVFGSLFFHFIKYFVYFNLTANAAERLHNKMLRSVFFSPIPFFDKNPLGRIISRFSNDISIIDKNLVSSLLEVLEGFSLFLVYVFALWITDPYIIISAVVATCFGVLLYLWCRKAIYQTRGLELITRAPLYSYFSYAVDSLATIRARKVSNYYVSKFFKGVDDYSRANMAHMVSVRFLRFWVDYITELTVIVTLCIFISSNSQALQKGYFFNILIYLPYTMSWLLRGFLTLDLFMSSVARITTYIERAISVDLVKPNDEEIARSGWPKTGNIEIRNATLRYSAKSEPFMRDITLDIRNGEKLAVIGSSRSAMANLLTMLLRFFDIDRNSSESYIKIDGINTMDIGLNLLRNQMVIIPQESCVITGTIRSNLDPWENYTDEEIWEALQITGLRDYIKDLKYQLNTPLSKGSSVFSMGQRQLFCMTRALLKKGVIVIQDDATSHVDLSASQAVQMKILEKYKDSTVIVMTHRMLTIALYDKVIITHKGSIVEYGEPYLLLVKKIGDIKVTNKETEFGKMVKNVGKSISKVIVKVAMQSYYKRHGIDFPSSIGSLIIEEAFEKGLAGRQENDEIDFNFEEGDLKEKRGDVENRTSVRPFNKFS